VDAGLHLDLCEAGGGGHVGGAWPRLVTQAQLGLLDTTQLRGEVAFQLDRFEDDVGRAPDFVDGHRHVHQLPGVRDVLLDELARRYPSPGPWLRRTVPRGACAAKPWVIAALGAPGLDRLCRQRALRHNGRLLGAYGFADDPPRYQRRLAQWLASAHDGDLLMCHPARSATGPDDPIAPARTVEYLVLRAPAFGRLLAEARVEVERMSRIVA